MKIKKRFLFPSIYLIAFVISLQIPIYGVVIFMLGFPAVYIVHLIIEATLDSPIDGMYFAIAGAVIQYFILGYLWDITAEWFRKDLKPL